MKRLRNILLLVFVITCFGLAQDTPKIDTGDTTWVLISTALVMLMTPGLALFYGGMVRKKNILGTIMHSFISLGIVTIIWVLYGYSFAFSPSTNGFIGGFEWIGLRGVGLAPNPNYAGTIPHQLFMLFQMMFAIITPALISGAIAERMKFSAYIVFIILWSTIVYLPLAHSVWAVGGWIRNLGALDFAGGLVVHISSGATALAAAIVLGKRKGWPHEITPPHNVTMTVLGAGLLWFGWFGFNAGSAFASGALAVSAFVATHIAAATATLSWVIVEWLHRGKPTILGAVSGSVAGLVAITPASGFVGPFSALLIGLLAGGVCYYGVSIKSKFDYDDALDAVGVHGVGGTLGALATGLFASTAINSAGFNGLFYGNPLLLLYQTISVIVVIAYSFSVSWILLKVLDKTIGLRITVAQELEGLDVSQHGESGYTM